jgi:DNA-binding IclR family transcriptional regulator
MAKYTIQVLMRATSILEYLAQAPEADKALGEIASSVKLHTATCARILMTLVECGYAEQLGYKKGYRLGPMAYALSAKGPYRKDLVQAADPFVTRLASAIQENVVLATISQGLWIVLCEADGERSVQVSRDFLRRQADPWSTATGRTMIAGMTEQELDMFLARRGMPAPSVWPEVASGESLRAELAGIRRKGWVLCDYGESISVAFPVEQGGRVSASIGSHLPKFRFSSTHREAVMEGLRETAAAIQVGLTRRHAL